MSAPEQTSPKAKREKPKSRPARWSDACSRMLAAFDAIEQAVDDLEAAGSDLYDVQQEYSEWKDNLPENLQQSALGEKLEAVCDFSIEDIAANVRNTIEEGRGVIEEAESVDLPRGFGKD